MAKIVLLSCTKSKLDKPAPAKEMYSPSPMFQRTKEYGETLKPDKTFILSAKHGLLPMNKIIKPYDLTLKNMNRKEKDEWGERVRKQMIDSGLKFKSDRFIFLTGSEYMKPLEKFIPAQNIENPMKGKRLGERLSWLNAQVKKLKEFINQIKTLIYEIVRK